MRRRNLKGMTLVEVTVAIAIFAILVAMASGIILTAGNIFAKASRTTKAQDIASAVGEVLNSRLSYATEITFGGSAPEVGTRGYSECIRLGKLDKADGEYYVSINREGKKSGASYVFDEACDTGSFKVQVTYEGITQGGDEKNKLAVMNFLIDVYASDGSSAASLEYAVDLLNIPAVSGDDSWSTETSEEYISYTLAE